MIIEHRQVKLIRLTHEYIDLVRQKRNLPEIQKRMEYREYITPEMQEKWYASINNIYNYYFLIEINGALAGLLSAAGIDWDNGIVNNGGIFIWDETYLRSPEILEASLLLTDLGFYVGIKKNRIRILKDNDNAILYNRSLGYTLLPGQENVYNQVYELSANAYFNITQKLKQHLWFNSSVKITITASEYMENAELIKKINITDKLTLGYNIEVHIT